VVEFVARVRAASAVCPGCGTVSARVHGRYRRRLVDAAVAGSSVVISLVVRRFRCEQEACAAVTFAEQVAGLTSPHARYTPLAERMVTAIGLAAAGRAGARLAAQLGIAAGRDTLLRRVRALPDPPVGAVAVLVSIYPDCGIIPAGAAAGGGGLRWWRVWPWPGAGQVGIITGSPGRGAVKLTV
jgi:hypothetical protein